MQMNLRSKKLFSLLLCMMLIVAMACSTTGCNEKTPPVQQTESQRIGEGDTKFTFLVFDKDGEETAFEVHTDQEIVGAALLELGLISGDEGEFGLYVKTVNGITADYEVDQTYWAFYVNGEYATSGVDTTKIQPGDVYAFRVEK